MIDDIGDSLSTIRKHYQQSLVTLLLDIQKAEIQHLKSTKFIETLECLSFSGQNSIPNISALLTRLECAYQPTTYRCLQQKGLCCPFLYLGSSFTFEAAIWQVLCSITE